MLGCTDFFLAIKILSPIVYLFDSLVKYLSALIVAKCKFQALLIVRCNSLIACSLNFTFEDARIIIIENSGFEHREPEQFFSKKINVLLSPCDVFESFRRDLNEAKAVSCNVVNYLTSSVNTSQPPLCN